MTGPGYLSLRLDGFLDAVAAREPAPSGGAVAAVAVGLGAGLVAMAAGFSTAQLDDAAELVASAERLRAEVTPLADRDAVVYTDVLVALRLPKDTPDRAERLRAALSAATDVPTQVARIGAQIVELAARVEQYGNPKLRGDALTGRMLAVAGTRSAAGLVALNLSDHFDPRVVETAELAARVASSAQGWKAGE